MTNDMAVISLVALLSALLFPSVLCSSCPNGFTLINFDEFSGSEMTIPPLYYGFEWTNGYVLIPSTYPNSGYGTALNSGQYVGFNGFGNPMLISVGVTSTTETFSIKSFVCAAAWNNDLLLSIIGERSGMTLYRKSFILQKERATNVVLDWNNIDRIVFTTSGGIGPGTHFAMDNLCITTGPEERRELLYKCDYWGDPQLIKFPKNAGETASSTWCQIAGPSILYKSSYVLIKVINSGSGRGDIVTSFDMTLYDANKLPLCTLTPSDVTGTPRSCGPDVVISKTGTDLNVEYRKAPFSAWIKYSSWGGGHYKFTLFATLAHINEASTTGMCVKGCSGIRNAPQIIITDSTTDKEIVTSAMADSVCDTFIKQATHQLPQNDLVPETTPGYIDAVRQACIIDVTVTGSTQFAEHSVGNIITDVLTHTGEVKIEEFASLIQNTTMTAQQTVNETEVQVDAMIEGSTWPCQPNVPVCIIPFLIRQKFANIIRK